MTPDPPPHPDDNKPTLGEILGAALRGDLSDADVAEQEALRLAEDAQYRAALELSDQLAPLFSVPSLEVFNALCTVPDEMLVLLETPQGWAELAGHIAPDFHLPVVTYQPTIH